MIALEHAKQICYSTEETLLFTYEQAKRYADSDGVYVECGVAAGAQIIAMAAGAPNKTIYAFDSFQGIPLPSNKDDQYPGIRKLTKAEQKALPKPGKQKLESSGATAATIGQFWENIMLAGIPTENIVAVPGWFEETLPTINTIEKISILRLDGDLYNSTLVCLKYLFPLVIDGGLIIIDDYELPGCRKALFDYFGGELKHPLKFVSNIAYFIK
jgi:O-methyltransferase